MGHLPPALYETQIRAYFSQFGTVTRFRLSRSKRVRLDSFVPYKYVSFDSLQSVFIYYCLAQFILERGVGKI